MYYKITNKIINKIEKKKNDKKHLRNKEKINLINKIIK